MLQLTKFYEQCYRDYTENHPTAINVEELFHEIDKKRKQASFKNFALFLDRFIWTDKREHIDDPIFDIGLKKEIIEGLHLKNKICRTYSKSIEILRPLIEKINKEENRPAKLLELGSGSGKLTMAIYEEFKKSSLQVELTGSDIIPEYLSQAHEEAQKKNYKIDFKMIDAYHLGDLPENSFDLIFTLHSMHHFNPEELSRVMSGSQKVARTGFIGVDGYRGFGNLFFMFLSGGGKSLLSANATFLHDSLISGRKMYSASQLEIMARMSCPNSFIQAKNIRPGLTYINIQRNE